MKVKTMIVTMFAIVAAFVPVLVPTVALAADAKQSICEGVGIAGGGSGCTNPSGGPTVESAISAAINLISIVVGVIAVIMIIIGGLKYILSSGDSNNINSAKNTILYAIIGLVIVAFAQVIVRYVLNNV
jgi:hypothetical protein